MKHGEQIARCRFLACPRPAVTVDLTRTRAPPFRLRMFPTVDSLPATVEDSCSTQPQRPPTRSRPSSSLRGGTSRQRRENRWFPSAAVLLSEIVRAPNTNARRLRSGLSSKGGHRPSRFRHAAPICTRARKLAHLDHVCTSAANRYYLHSCDPRNSVHRSSRSHCFSGLDAPAGARPRLFRFQTRALPSNPIPRAQQRLLLCLLENSVENWDAV